MSIDLLPDIHKRASSSKQRDLNWSFVDGTKDKVRQPAIEIVGKTDLVTITSGHEFWGDSRMTLVAESKNDEYGGSIGLREDEVDEFMKLGLYPDEYSYYQNCMTAALEIKDALPVSSLREAFPKAVEAKVLELLHHVRSRFLDGAPSQEEQQNIWRSERELGFALGAIMRALSLYAVSNGDSHYDTHAWDEAGHRDRKGGYHAAYRVCNDTFDADEEDHQSQLEVLKKEEAEGAWVEWPDFFHHPGKLEIHVNPDKRIEFVYTPEIETAAARHQSHSSTVYQSGEERFYENENLSIRIDLDSYAPSGVALDIGRSAYVGKRNERNMRRSADLLGGVFAEASETANHEYTGFEEGMKEEFRNFAERLMVQLHLQHKEHLDWTRKGDIARAAIKRFDT